MKQIFQIAIEEHYGLEVARLEAGARQFFADTYIIHVAGGEQFFCKINTRPIIIPEIIRGLPALEEMHAKGIENINYPIRGKSGLFCMVEGALIVLFNYVAAPQHYNYSEYALGKLLAQIHAVTPELSVQMPREGFEYLHRAKFERHFEASLASKSNDDNPVSALGTLLRQYEAEVRYLYSEYLRLCGVCRGKDIEMVVTHGDAPGNVLVKSPDDIYLIDWDGLLLAPAEWDTWMMDHHPQFMQGYTSVRPGFTVDNDVRSFSIYKYYFQSFAHYFEEIFGDFDEAHKLRYIGELEDNLIRGWMLPRLKEINPEMKYNS